jgi:hypothetical protein
MSETSTGVPIDSSELAEQLRRMLTRFEEFRGRL